MITTTMICCRTWRSLQVLYTQTRHPRLVVGDQWSIDLLAIWRGLLQSLSWTFYGWNLFIHLKTSDRTVACCLVSSTTTLSGGGSNHHSDKLKMATGFMSNCGWKGWWIVLLIGRSLKRSVSPKLATIVVLNISVTFVKVKLTCYGEEVFLGSISWVAGLDLFTFCFCFNATLLCTKLVTWILRSILYWRYSRSKYFDCCNFSRELDVAKQTGLLFDHFTSSEILNLNIFILILPTLLIDVVWRMNFHVACT